MGAPQLFEELEDFYIPTCVCCEIQLIPSRIDPDVEHYCRDCVRLEHNHSPLPHANLNKQPKRKVKVQ